MDLYFSQGSTVFTIFLVASVLPFFRVWWMVQLSHVKERPQHGHQELEHRALQRAPEGGLHQSTPWNGRHRSLAAVPQERSARQTLHTRVFGQTNDASDRWTIA